MARTTKFYIQIDTPESYSSTDIQVSCEQYWNEYKNCKKVMNDHNEDIEKDEFYDCYAYSYNEKTDEFDTCTKITRIFYLNNCNVYLTEIKCKKGYQFKTKHQIREEKKNANK